MANNLPDGWKRGMPKNEGKDGVAFYAIWHLKGNAIHRKIEAGEIEIMDFLAMRKNKDSDSRIRCKDCNIWLARDDEVCPGCLKAPPELSATQNTATGCSKCSRVGYHDDDCLNN